MGGPEWAWGGTLEIPYVRGIYDTNGYLISDTTGHIEVLFTPEEDGTYYVSAGAQVTGERERDVGTYIVKVSIDDFTADVTTTGSVEVTSGSVYRRNSKSKAIRDGSHVTNLEDGQDLGKSICQLGQSKSNDRDWFELPSRRARRPNRYGRLEAGTLANPFLLSIRDADGDYLRNANGRRTFAGSDFDSGEGLNSRSTFTPNQDGTYYLVAGSGGWQGSTDSNGRSLGTYTLSVEEVVEPIVEPVVEAI